MDKLKPCPFCGGEAQTLRIGSWWSIACRTPFCCDVGKCDTEAEAIEAWNTRAERTCHIVRVDADPDRVLESIMPKGYSVFFERCSECGETIPSIKESTERANYCPSCGAKVVNTDE